MDCDHLAADGTRQLPDDIGVVAVEAVCDTQYPREPLDNRALTVVEGLKPPVPGCVWKGLRMIAGNEGAREAILLVETGDIKFLNHVATELMVLS